MGPERLLTVFNPEEIELLMCGMKPIDLDDWKRNSIYTGEFQSHGEYHPICDWFWDMVENYLDQDSRLKLFQFATGMSSPPPGGFAELLNQNGSHQRFTLHGIRYEECPFPICRYFAEQNNSSAI